MLPRTQRQKDILDYITRFSERNRYEPSYAQIARHFGVKSRATIAKHIAALERRGLISRTHEDGSFALSVKVDDPDALCQVKLLGRIAAGTPLDVVESDETLSVPRFLLGQVKPDRVYALRVKGDSMIDEHICDGDIALIENRTGTEVRDGEIVVALLIEENQATLKKLYRRGANVELHPANSQLQPLTLPANQVSVQGVFRGLLRPTV